MATKHARSLISLYTGAGGLDLGFEAAGFETRVAGELDADAVRTLRHNRDWPLTPRTFTPTLRPAIESSMRLGLERGRQMLSLAGRRASPLASLAIGRRVTQSA